MNIAIMSHDNRKDLMVQFCTAYAGILSQHNLYATNTTGHMVAEATGLKVLPVLCPRRQPADRRPHRLQ